MQRRGSARDAAAFLLSAGVALLGGAAVFKAGSALAPMSGATGAARPGISLLVIVLLFGVTGLLLVMMAGKELLALRRRP